MRKITLMTIISLLSFACYAQLAEEGFETGWTLAPTGASAASWFTIQNDVAIEITWVQGEANNTQQPAYEGERAAYLQRQNVLEGIPEDYLVTPKFTVPTDPELQFYSRLTFTENQGSIYKIFIINLTDTPNADLNSPAAYTEIQSWTELEINPAQTTYYQKTVRIPHAYIGAKVRIAFMMVGDDMDSWLIDNVSVVKKCIPPTGITASNATTRTVDLAWEGSAAGEWEYYIVEATEPAPLSTTHGIHTTTNPTIGAGALIVGTNYKYYVKALWLCRIYK